ncbi:hypothetical protein KIN20_034022 [Parelaphostrongylus tenuis]|uniref:Uncharacterized protein n=1 Tax=Parelaphostrongylus tenuis TaxID=148309 RepID=A0AAD5R9P8_PARTN|nr:hypothetical protein KIN20_034022 [Parelaphostrongylus tenuis]
METDTLKKLLRSQSGEEENHAKFFCQRSASLRICSNSPFFGLESMKHLTCLFNLTKCLGSASTQKMFIETSNHNRTAQYPNRRLDEARP